MMFDLELRINTDGSSEPEIGDCWIDHTLPPQKLHILYPRG